MRCHAMLCDQQNLVVDRLLVRTGLSVLTTDSNGFDHSIVIEVADPHSLDSACPAGVSPCLADGALTVLLDGEESLLAPGTVVLGEDVEISAANLPGACRSFGFEKVRRTKLYHIYFFSGFLRLDSLGCSV